MERWGGPLPLKYSIFRFKRIHAPTLEIIMRHIRNNPREEYFMDEKDNLLLYDNDGELIGPDEKVVSVRRLISHVSVELQRYEDTSHFFSQYISSEYRNDWGRIFDRMVFWKLAIWISCSIYKLNLPPQDGYIILDL